MLKKVLLSLILLFLSYKPLFSQAEFLTDYRISYQVLPNGLTKAHLEISLINQLSNLYATEFTLSIGSTQLSQIRVSDAVGLLQPEIIIGNKTTNITIPFREKVFGKDKAQSFSLEFLSADFSHQVGNIWEISIPRFSRTENLRHYDLTLIVPQAFGAPSRMVPTPASQANQEQSVVYRFYNEDLWEQGISATFGSVQYFNFHLTYHLDNPNLFPVTTEIALPPDTAWQTVIYSEISPEPESLKQDSDANWLATYYLNPRQNLSVIASGSAEIYLNPKPEFQQPLNPDADYLSRQQYWESDNPRIMKLAGELNTPFKIYQYLVDNLVYDYGKINKPNIRSAANIMDNPSSAICTDFTDLFVAIARAAGIPSRSVNGFAYTTNPNLRPLSLEKDILHAWPEYYDVERKLWVPIDPTWGNTTGGVDFFTHPDLNHFSFVMQGADSQYPVPAGAYKSAQTETKDVLIDFGLPVAKTRQLDLKFALPPTILAGVDTHGQLVLKNSGNLALYGQKVRLMAPGLKLNQTEWQIPVLLPKSSFNLDFTINPTAWNTNKKIILQAETDLAAESFILTIKPFYLAPQFRLAVLAGAGILLIIALKIIYNQTRV